MTTPIKEITKHTLVPLGIFAAGIVVAFNIGADREKSLAGIQANAVKIKQVDRKVRDMEEVLAELTDGVRRLEIHLGTLPKGGGQP